MDTSSMQKRMQEIQNNEEQIQGLFGKLVSGKKDYKAIIDKTKQMPKCSCGKILSGEEKFCPECGCALKKSKY